MTLGIVLAYVALVIWLATKADDNRCAECGALATNRNMFRLVRNEYDKLVEETLCSYHFAQYVIQQEKEL